MALLGGVKFPVLASDPIDNPSAGKIFLYTLGSNVKYKTSAGDIYTLATGVTPEDVQDIVGTFISAGSSKLSVSYNDSLNVLVIDVVEANISHQNLNGAGTNTHAQIDSHISNASNPHATTAVQVGADPVGSAAAAQAFAIQRANHTGTQLASTISDFSEAVDDRVGSLVVAGTGITATYNDGANSLTIATTISQYTDEQAQDAVGTILTDSSSVDFTYNDAGNTITAAVLPAGVNHDALSNFVANEHIDHSTVSISAGAGLSGGGDITANRTISMPNVGTAGTYGSASQVPAITTDAQGRVTGVSLNNIVTYFNDFGDGPVYQNEDGRNFIIEQSINTVDQSAFIEQRRSRGTTASKVPVLSGDKLGGQTFIGWNGTNWAVRNAELSVWATENYTTTAAGAELRISTVENGTNVDVNRLIVRNNGQLDVLNNKIIQVATPTAGTDAVNKTYADGIQAFAIQRANHTGTQLASTISDFSEATQDVVGAMLTDSASVDFTYNDAGNSGSFAVLPAGVNHNALQNYVANEHINHTSISISAGTGLSGGGDISINRTLSIANTGVTAGSYGGAAGVPNLTVNAQGQLTAISNGPALVLGDNFEYFEDLTAATTTSNVYNTAATFTTTTKDVGQYRVASQIVFNPHATSNDVLFRVLVDGTQIGPEFKKEYSEIATQQVVIQLWGYVNFAVATTHTITIQFRTETNASGTLTCQQVYTEMWRRG